MKTTLTLLAAILVAGLVRGDETLAVMDIEGGPGGFDFVSNQDEATFTMGNANGVGEDYTLLNSFSVDFTPSEVGQTVVVMPAADPQFFANLTNGTSDFVESEYAVDPPTGGIGGEKSPENKMFAYTVATNGVDLAGFALSDITIKLNTLTFNSPGSNPNQDGKWTNYDFNATLAIHGTPLVAVVPEPSTWALLFLSLGGLIFARRRFAAVRS